MEGRVKANRWPLHTTGCEENDLWRMLFEEDKRMFIWIHVFSIEERNGCVRILENEGWEIIEPMPCYYILACRPKVPTYRRRRMRDLVFPDLNEADVNWMGNEFGYPDEDIAWYIDANRAARRAWLKVQLAETVEAEIDG